MYGVDGGPILRPNEGLIAALLTRMVKERR